MTAVEERCAYCFGHITHVRYYTTDLICSGQLNLRSYCSERCLTADQQSGAQGEAGTKAGTKPRI